ncbi:transcriptional repressor [Azospirillum sp. RWY-5-1]|uniref:Transcriptional repressor n=1 Tax=Azospirillum oleiclasticum TaxID=2735135 RepID=A0ABX2T471_9PROT|nr:Fur family transcriptional regulator [Azospirillum oleiclasticum]NYZ11479.1 transcriptional repressor [Azospirillum oleiclasticum]NYZ18640.1 transcriptional repressor [Azospirillum oleiclasticum]
MVPPSDAATHDHDHCIHDALTRAEALCAKRGAKLTILRRRVLELVWTGHKPRGAYAILEDLSRAEGKATAPLTVYRALEFLVEQGLVHRIESLNAYIGCPEPGAAHSGQFMVCERCGDAIEIDDPRIRAAIAASAAEHGFRVIRPTVEVRGICPHCQPETDR